eukprot:3378715-Rhodomonas_salina.2
MDSRLSASTQWELVGRRSFITSKDRISGCPKRHQEGGKRSLMWKAWEYYGQPLSSLCRRNDHYFRISLQVL